MGYNYKVLAQIRANGTQYSVGDTFPSNLKKVNYDELLNNGLIEKQSMPEKPLIETVEKSNLLESTPVSLTTKRIQKNIKEN